MADETRRMTASAAEIDRVVAELGIRPEGISDTLWGYIVSLNERVAALEPQEVETDE